MGSRQLAQVVHSHSAKLKSLAQTGDEYRDNFYLHALRYKRAKEMGGGWVGPMPMMPPPDFAQRAGAERSIEKLETQLQHKTRTWEHYNQVLGHTARSHLRRPRELLQLVSLDKGKPMTDDDDGVSGAGAGAGEGAGAGADGTSTSSESTGLFRDGQTATLWRARGAVEAVCEALLGLDDSQHLLSFYQASGRPVPEATVKGQHTRILSLQRDLAKRLGITPEPKTMEDAASLLELLSLSKGKRVFCQAVASLDAAGLAAAVTSGIRWLPYFVASTSSDPDAEAADLQLSSSLASWINTSGSAVASAAAAAATSTNKDDTTGIEMRKAAHGAALDAMIALVDVLQTSHEPDILRALFGHSNAALVVGALFTRAEAEAEALRAIDAENEAALRWQGASERLALTIEQQAM